MMLIFLQFTYLFIFYLHALYIKIYEEKKLYIQIWGEGNYTLKYRTKKCFICQNI